MAYACIRNPRIECDACGACKEFYEEEEEEISCDTCSNWIEDEGCFFDETPDQCGCYHNKEE